MEIYILENWKSKINTNEPKEKWSTNIIQCMFDNILIKKDERGKPYIVNQNQFINWSHTDQALVIALSNLGQIGVDVEEKDISYEEDLYGWILHAQEKYEIKRGTLFSEIWTRKEAILKFTGEGIHDQMCNINCYDPKYNVYSFAFNNIFISICSEYKITNYKTVYKYL